MGITPPACAVLDEAYTMTNEDLRKLAIIKQGTVEHLTGGAQTEPLTSPW